MTTVLDKKTRPRMKLPKRGNDRACHRRAGSSDRTQCGIVVKPRPHSKAECKARNHVRCPVCFQEEFFA